MTDLLGCEKGECTASRCGDLSGYYTRQLTMKVGTLELRVPKDCDGRLCRYDFSHTTNSNMVAELDGALRAFVVRRLDDSPFPYVLLEARYEKVREGGAVRTCAAQLAIGIDTVRRRHLRALELADRESENTWTTFLSGLKARGLKRVAYVASCLRLIRAVVVETHGQ